MDYVNLGHTGLKVSRLCPGCMSFGEAEDGTHAAWTLDGEARLPLIKQAPDAGINFFDTANGYSAGTSEGTAETRGHGADHRGHQTLTSE